ncbi:unnamed protein product [Linum trigynum]|uniref:Uncharacterized protein n=1 Tax=Linum trigynum TaxID=586398 RepID=A0AAV2FG35_9ROSI
MVEKPLLSSAMSLMYYRGREHEKEVAPTNNSRSWAQGPAGWGLMKWAKAHSTEAPYAGPDLLGQRSFGLKEWGGWDWIEKQKGKGKASGGRTRGNN